MCASALAADLPDEDHEFFEKFMIVLDNNMTDNEIIDKISYYLENEKERERIIQKGLELNKEYTQERYAERFLKEIEEFLDGVA
jgi:spore maturation protein CgeB